MHTIHSEFTCIRNCLLFLMIKFMKEFSRVVEENTVRKSAREKWKTWTPRILALAQKDNSSVIKMNTTKILTLKVST